MSIEVKFSGRYRFLTGVESCIVDATELDTIEDVVIEIVFEYSSLKVDRARIMVFRDGVTLSYDEKVFDGDVLVFAPPLVSGG